MKHDYRSIDLTCKSCGGTREIDQKNKLIVCPYCGSKEQLIDIDQFSDDTPKTSQKNAQNAADIEKSKTGKFSKVILAFFVIALLFAVLAFSFSHTSSDTNKHVRYDWPANDLATMIPDPDLKYGRIDTNNADEFSIDLYKCSEKDYLSYVEECKDCGFIVDEKTERTSYHAYTEDGYMLDLFFYSSMDEMRIDLKAPVRMHEINWSDIDAFAFLPAPKSNQGKIVYEYEYSVYVYVGDMTRTDYDEYVQACKDAGFSKDMMRSDDYYYAYRGSQYLSLEFLGYNMMSISISGEYDKNELTTTDTSSGNDTSEDTKSLIPDPDTSADESDAATESDAGQTNDIVSLPAESDNMQSNEVSPEFKQTLDEYEAFIDDYIAFLNRYEDSDDVSGMLIEYTGYITKFSEIMAELDSVNESELSDADALYFTEVSARIYQKLMGSK